MATVKQKVAFKEVLNGSTITKAMVTAGYSPTTASTTGKLTNTQGWQQLLKKHLPDSILAKRHRQMLNKTEKIVVSDGARDGSHLEDTGQPHSDVNKALEMAYKLKGAFPTEGQDVNRTLVLVVSGETALRYGLPTHTKPESSSP